MPGVDKDCEGPGATHHFACKCREAHFTRLEEKLKLAVSAMEAVCQRYGRQFMRLDVLQQALKEIRKP